MVLAFMGTNLQNAITLHALLLYIDKNLDLRETVNSYGNSYNGN